MSEDHAYNGYVSARIIAWRTFKAFLIVGGLVFWSWAGFWIARQEREVTITGWVVDAQTGKHVPNAKVVVSTWYYGIDDSNPTNYGTLTDDEGEFRVHANPDYWIKSTDITGSTPDDKYVRRMRLRTRRITLKANFLEYDQKDIDSYHYSSFAPWGSEINWQK